MKLAIDRTATLASRRQARARARLSGLAAGAGTALCLLALALGAAPAEAGSTCPGRNGKVAVVLRGFSSHGVGVLSPGRRMRSGRARTVFEKSTGDREDPFSFTSASFACDGRWLALSTRDRFPPRVYLEVLDVVSGRIHSVPTKRISAGFPAFVRGGWIVFSGSRGGRGATEGTFAVRPDGSGLHRLFRRQQMAASPDARWFVTTGPHNPRLFLLNRRGRVVRPLTPPAPGDMSYLNAAISPNGRWITYELRHSDPFHAALFVVRRDGTHRRRLTFGPEAATEPVFSPDGRWVAFTRSQSGTPDGSVYALNVRHPQRKPQLSLSGGYKHPAWGPR